jgi:hypothetical protein
VRGSENREPLVVRLIEATALVSHQRRELVEIHVGIKEARQQLAVLQALERLLS